MAMGKRKQRQESLFIMADGLPRSAGHPFYQKLNELLAEADFDRWIERRCERPLQEVDKRVLILTGRLRRECAQNLKPASCS